MSNICQVEPGHRVAPEEHGYQPHFFITKNAAVNYPWGHFIYEDPLQPANRKIELDYAKSQPELKDKTKKEREDFCSALVFETTSAGAHKHFLDMRVHSVTSRGRGVLAALVLSGLYAFCIWLTVVLSPDIPDIAESFSLYNQIVFISASVFILWDLFRPLATPVRFHQKNKEVYVWHKGVLYRIPWRECEISVIIDQIHMGYGHLKDGYQVVMWLNPKHATNKNLIGKKHRKLVLADTMDEHRFAYYYWEYIRRYMVKDKSLFYEVDQEDREPRFIHKRAWRCVPFSLINTYVFTIIIALLFRPHKISLWFGPFRCRWPKEVHKWSGEKCNWL